MKTVTLSLAKRETVTRRALAAIVSGRDPGIAFPFLQTK